ncbi:MAG: NAD(P)/FAD-dependent oxidoreductase [Acidobacteriaceae bacterium]
MKRSNDVLILGGGPAGATLGTLLAREGRAVEILEKTTGPHDKVCGEFLSHEAVHYLLALGIEPARLGAAPVSRLRLAGQDLIRECPLPFTGISLRRRALDEALLDHARAAGAMVARGVRVELLQREGFGWVAHLANGERRSAATVFLATGKHDLHGWARPPGGQSDLVAFKMYFRLALGGDAARLARVEIILFPGGYAGLLFFPDGTMNVCLLIQRSVLRRCGGQWTNLVQLLQRSSPYLAQYLADAEALLTKPLALSSIPYGYVCPGAPDGLWRLGDQAAVIPSFSGDGISIALHSAYIAAENYLAGKCADDFQQQLCRQVERPVRTATTISRLMIQAPALSASIRLWPQILGGISRRTRISQADLRV